MWTFNLFSCTFLRYIATHICILRTNCCSLRRTSKWAAIFRCSACLVPTVPSALARIIRSCTACENFTDVPTINHKRIAHSIIVPSGFGNARRTASSFRRASKAAFLLFLTAVTTLECAFRSATCTAMTSCRTHGSLTSSASADELNIIFPISGGGRLGSGGKGSRGGIGGSILRTYFQALSFAIRASRALSTSSSSTSSTR
mmetsp:Transcript_60881/g.112961  ORF Transcript_60881/g.112961 Transcript_60881/m.112961 type:complete len:202 (+) Transcript_60881:902-1507(+)